MAEGGEEEEKEKEGEHIEEKNHDLSLHLYKNFNLKCFIH